MLEEYLGWIVLALSLSVLVFLVVYILIAFEIIDKTAAALAGAAIVILLKLVPYEEAMHSVDMNVIFLLIGMMIVMSILAETGFLNGSPSPSPRKPMAIPISVLQFFLSPPLSPPSSTT